MTIHISDFMDTGKVGKKGLESKGFRIRPRDSFSVTDLSLMIVIMNLEEESPMFL